uniref:ARAD1B21076p n=1 Tax=Blastobotrys adeninivorans TaxID=409370 RepID=A0A060TD33_BLAAD
MDKNESDAVAHNQGHAEGEDSKHVSSLTPVSTREAADSDQSSQYSESGAIDSDADNDSVASEDAAADVMDSYLDSDGDEEEVAPDTTTSAPEIATGPAAQPETGSAKGAKDTDQPRMDEDEPTSKANDPIKSAKDSHIKSLDTESSTVSSVKNEASEHEYRGSTTDSAVKQDEDTIKQDKDSIDHSSKVKTDSATPAVKKAASEHNVESDELADPDSTPAEEKKAQPEHSQSSAVDSSARETRTVSKTNDAEIHGEKPDDASDSSPRKQTGDADQENLEGEEREADKTNSTSLESESSPSEHDKLTEPEAITAVDKHESKSAPAEGSSSSAKMKQAKEINEPETDKSIAEENETEPEDDTPKPAPIASSVDPVEENDTSEIASVKSIDKTEAPEAAPTQKDVASGELSEDDKGYDECDQAENTPLKQVEDAIEPKTDRPFEQEKAVIAASNDLPEKDDLAGSSTEKQTEAESHLGIDKPSMVDKDELDSSPTVAASEQSTDSGEPEKETPVGHDEKNDGTEKDTEEVKPAKTALSESDSKTPAYLPVDSTEKSVPKNSDSVEQAKDETDRDEQVQEHEKASTEGAATLSKEKDDNDKSGSSSEKIKEVEANDETQSPENTVPVPTPAGSKEGMDISTSSDVTTDSQAGAEPDSLVAEKSVKTNEDSEPSESANLPQPDNSLSEKTSTPLPESKPEDTKDVHRESADTPVSEGSPHGHDASPESVDAPVSGESSSGLKVTTLDSDSKDKPDLNVQESVSHKSEQQERSILVDATVKSSNESVPSGAHDGIKEKDKELDAEEVMAAASKSGEDKASEKSGNNDSDRSDGSEDDQSESESDSSDEESGEESDEDSEESDSEEEQPKIYIYTSFTSGTHYVTPDTYRLAAILEAHDIKFEVIDLATNERAKRLWKLWGKGRRLPAVVRDDEVVGNYSQIQEAVENSELREVVLEDEIMPYRP